MSTSAESLAVGQPRRMSRVWKIVVAVALAIVAVPVALGVGSWAGIELGSPGQGSVSSTVTN